MKFLSRKKYIFINTFFLSIIFLMNSCEKVIELDLNSADPQIVVEANLSDNPTQRAEVRLSQTINFTESNNFPPLSNAVVFIKNQTTGATDTLRERSQGYYRADNLVGVIGQTYDLTVLVNGKTLTASATIPRKVNFDSLRTLRQAGFGGQQNVFVIPVFTDLKDIGDKYRFVMTVNNKLIDNIFLFDDILSDGTTNARPLLVRGDNALKVGDIASLEMRCLDAGSYKYFSTVQGGGGGPNSNSATPTNPITNIKGGALGYFGAYNSQVKTITIR